MSDNKSGPLERPHRPSKFLINCVLHLICSLNLDTKLVFYPSSCSVLVMYLKHLFFFLNNYGIWANLRTSIILQNTCYLPPAHVVEEPKIISMGFKKCKKSTWFSYNLKQIFESPLSLHYNLPLCKGDATIYVYAKISCFPYIHCIIFNEEGSITPLRPPSSAFEHR